MNAIRKQTKIYDGLRFIGITRGFNPLWSMIDKRQIDEDTVTDGCASACMCVCVCVCAYTKAIGNR